MQLKYNTNLTKVQSLFPGDNLTAISCVNEEQKREFLKIMGFLDLRWSSGEAPLVKNLTLLKEAFGEDFCFSLTHWLKDSGYYSSKDFYIEMGYTIVPFSQFAEIMGLVTEPTKTEEVDGGSTIETNANLVIDRKNYKLGFSATNERTVFSLDLWQIESKDFTREEFQELSDDINEALERFEQIEAGFLS